MFPALVGVIRREQFKASERLKKQTVINDVM